MGPTKKEQTPSLTKLCPFLSISYYTHHCVFSEVAKKDIQYILNEHINISMKINSF